MKIFKDKATGKVNFVDENNVFVGYDMKHQCCEEYGWFLSDEIREEIPKKEFLEDEKGIKDLDLFVFDPGFYSKFWIKDKEHGEGSVIAFKMKNRDKEVYLHLFNCHNGFYGHGFEFKNERWGNTLLRDEL